MMNVTIVNRDPSLRRDVNLFLARVGKLAKPMTMGERIERHMYKMGALMYADTPLWRDLREPIQVTDLPSVTLTTTQKMLWAPGASNPMGNFPAFYWTVKKTVKLTAALKWTTGTAGSITFGMALGSADAAGVNVITAARTKVASVGPFLVFAEGYATCVSVGTAATLSMWGVVHFPLELILSTAGMTSCYPNAGVTVVGTFDSTLGTNGLFFQALTSAGADAVVPVGVKMEALN